MIIPVLALAIMLGAADNAASKPQDTETSQKIVRTTCNACHQKKKPLTADGLKGKSLEKMKGHMQKKGKLTDDQVTALVQYLESVRDGKVSK